MKKQKIPLLPLYIADSLMLIIALVIMISNASSGETLGSLQLFFCSVIVFFGAVLALAPYYFEFKSNKKPSQKNQPDEDDNFKIIFEELASLRLSIADTIEKIDDNNQSKNDVKILEQALLEQHNSVKNKFKEHNLKIESITAIVSDLNEKFSQQSTSKNDEVSQILFTLEQLKNTILNQPQEIDNESVIEENVDDSENTIIQEDVVEDTEVEIIKDNDFQEDVIEEDVAEQEHQETIESPLLKRALNNAIDTKNSVDKFIARNTALSEENQPPPTRDTIAAFEDSISEIEKEFEIDDDIYQPQPQEENTTKPDFFEVADSPKDVESAKKNNQNDNNLSLPFEDLPPTIVKQSPKKGDAVITVNTLIGIGNKPFLRGDDNIVSSEIGVCMQYEEIGVWSYIVPNLQEDMRFKILKNDTTLPLGESEFTISPNQKLTLNLAFPID